MSYPRSHKTNCPLHYAGLDGQVEQFEGDSCNCGISNIRINKKIIYNRCLIASVIYCEYGLCMTPWPLQFARSLY